MQIEICILTLGSLYTHTSQPPQDRHSSIKYFTTKRMIDGIKLIKFFVRLQEVFNLKSCMPLTFESYKDIDSNELQNHTFMFLERTLLNNNSSAITCNFER